MTTCVCFLCFPPTPLVVGEAPKRKRGRPPGSGKKKDAQGAEGSSAPAAPGAESAAGDATTATGEPAPPPVKRGRGRPKKVCCAPPNHVHLVLIHLVFRALCTSTLSRLALRVPFYLSSRSPQIKTPEELAAEEAKKNRPPAKRGRPRKKPKVDEEAPAPTADVPAPAA
jgi:hypothetical protein